MVVENLTPDAGVVKRVEVPGEGEKPSAHARVYIHYTLRSGGKVLESSRGSNEEISFRLGREKVVPGLEILVRSMSPGEVAVGTLSGDYTLRSRGINKPVDIEVRLIRVDQEEGKKDYLRMTPHERLEAATKYKENGNKYFKEAKFKKAMTDYLRAQEYLYYVFVDEKGRDTRTAVPENGDGSSSEAQALEEMVKMVKISTFNNLALCYAKEGSNKKVVKYANEVLSLDPRNAKALYHRGMARSNFGEMEEAKLDLQQAQKLNPEDLRVKNELGLLDKKIMSGKRREKRAYGAMFGFGSS
ncbi:hypothetical protein NDN08_002444 [Rhodosorus marinus]|uniref:peptidylprolyl isomerase n=1 Tax=Rhodosorus marinus TaxID=101924 RepID=A0AAV8UTU2_9RHOD|nr:hypothetical protein NDN08_002444 [Rhodosorus marinus]